MSSNIRIAIFGGSGYGGSELLRILLFHPNAEIVLVTANEHAGKPVAAVHRNLNVLTDLTFESAPADLSDIDADVAFFALPHGQAISQIPLLSASMMPRRSQNITNLPIPARCNHSLCMGSRRRTATRSVRHSILPIPDVLRPPPFSRSLRWSKADC